MQNTNQLQCYTISLQVQSRLLCTGYVFCRTLVLWEVFVLETVAFLFLSFTPHSATTKKLVDQYEQQCQDFMAGTTVNQFRELFPVSATPSMLSAGKVPIKLILLTKWGADTLDSLTELVGLFGVPGSHLHLSKIEEGCIAVIWLCSSSDVKELKGAILGAADSLQTRGVMKVFVGKELVLKFSRDVQGMFVVQYMQLPVCM